MTESRVWKLTISAPCPWLTANDTRPRFAQSELIKRWRVAGFTAARFARLPTGLAKVRIDVVARFRGRAPVRDRDNLRPTLKAVIDGLGPPRQFKRKNVMHVAVGHGLMPDDDDKHLDGPYLQIGEPLAVHPYAGVGELTLTITEVL